MLKMEKSMIGNGTLPKINCLPNHREGNFVRHQSEANRNSDVFYSLNEQANCLLFYV